MNNLKRLSVNDISSVSALGNGLEARIRGAQGRINGLARHSSIVVSSSITSPITTTLRTFGMPSGSANDLVSFLAAVDTLQVASTSTLDTSAGTGARQITIIGLDSTYGDQTELISLNGQTPVATTKSFLRINRILVEEVGSTGSNQGDIYISDSGDTFTLGVSQTQVLYTMLASETNQPQNISMFGCYTVPANRRLWLVKGNYYTSASQSKTLLIREDYFDLSNLGNRIMYGGGELEFSGSISFNFDGGGAFNPKTDYTFKVQSSTSTINGSLYYEAVLEDVNKSSI